MPMSRGISPRCSPKRSLKAKAEFHRRSTCGYGPDHRAFEVKEADGLERVDNWEAILKEISPEAYAVRQKVSPLDIAGYAFLWANRIKCLNYNTDLITEAELPQTIADLGNPKYKGAFSLSPFVTDAEFGTLIYPRDKWMEIVRTWGALNPAIMTYEAGVQRMLLGEFKFLPSNGEYIFEVKGKNPKAPIGVSFFKDLTANSYVFHMVRKNAKNPNAAKLFTLWTTTPEANRFFEVDYITESQSGFGHRADFKTAQYSNEGKKYQTGELVRQQGGPGKAPLVLSNRGRQALRR